MTESIMLMRYVPIIAEVHGILLRRASSEVAHKTLHTRLQLADQKITCAVLLSIVGVSIEITLRRWRRRICAVTRLLIVAYARVSE